MRQNKEIIFYSVLVFLGLIAVGFIIYTESNNKVLKNQNENINNTTYKEEQIEEVEETKPTISENKENSNQSTTNKKENSNLQTNNNKTNSNNSNTEKETTTIPITENKEIIESNKTEENLSTNDNTVINELNTIATSMDKLLKEGNDSSILDKAKGVFITLVDFCFYNGEIKGVTFDELTDTGKEKVLKIVNSIDTKIENKFPGYKDKISTKTKSAFNKASELIKKGANNIKEFAYDKLGEENYNAIIEEKDELVKYTKNAWDIVKNVSSNIWNSTKDKLKELYEKFKNNN